MKSILYSILVAALVSLAIGSGDVESEKLVKHIMEGYTTNLEPKDKDLTFGVNILCAMFDYNDGVMETSVEERYSWTDSRLSWPPSEYGGVEVVRIAIDEIWTPTIRLYNGIEHDEKNNSEEVVVKYTGNVMKTVFSAYSTLCSFENDAFECGYQFGEMLDSSHYKIPAWEEDPLLLYQTETCPLLATIKDKEIVDYPNGNYPAPFSVFKLQVTYRTNALKKLLSKLSQ